MPTELFVKYMREAKGIFAMKYNKKIEEIKFKEEDDKKIIFTIKPTDDDKVIEIEVKK